MAKQKKLLGSSFFDEMEEKMQIEVSKRRKLSKKTGHSQPELLFLQFKPDCDKFANQKNKFDSQPSISNVCKKPWRPPMKCPEEPEYLEFQRNKKLRTLSTDFLDESGTNNRVNDKIDCNKSDKDRNISNGQNIEIHSGDSVNSSISIHKHKENINSIMQDANINIGFADENCFQSCYYTQNDKEDCTNSVNCSAMAISLENERENLIKCNKNEKVLVCGDQENDFNIGNCNQYKNVDDSCSNNVNENIVSHKYTEDLRRDFITVEASCREEDDSIKMENSVIHEKEINKNQIEIDSSNLEKYLDKDDKENNYSEHDDIINSIDLILSEGKSIVQVDNSKNNNVSECEILGEQDGQNLAHSIFESSQSECDDHGDNIQNKTCNNKEEQQKDDLDNSLISNATECVSHLTNNTVTNIVHDKDSGKSSRSTPTTKLVLEEEDFDLILQKNINTPVKNDAISQHENNIVLKGLNKEIDEEYSSLMISHSELQAIEKTYYNNTSTPGISNKSKNPASRNNSCILTEVKCDSRTVGTQTDFIQEKSQLTNHCKSVAHLASVQWPMKMQNSQKQLRAVIQEIDRLNATLLKARQQVWPQRHGKLHRN